LPVFQGDHSHPILKQLLKTGDVQSPVHMFHDCGSMEYQY